MLSIIIRELDKKGKAVQTHRGLEREFWPSPRIFLVDQIADTNVGLFSLNPSVPEPIVDNKTQESYHWTHKAQSVIPFNHNRVLTVEHEVRIMLSIPFADGKGKPSCRRLFIALQVNGTCPSFLKKQLAFRGHCFIFSLSCAADSRSVILTDFKGAPQAQRKTGSMAAIFKRGLDKVKFSFFGFLSASQTVLSFYFRTQGVCGSSPQSSLKSRECFVF